jgi:hypothetical protein
VQNQIYVFISHWRLKPPYPLPPPLGQGAQEKFRGRRVADQCNRHVDSNEGSQHGQPALHYCQRRPADGGLRHVAMTNVAPHCVERQANPAGQCAQQPIGRKSTTMQQQQAPSGGIRLATQQ